MSKYHFVRNGSFIPKYESTEVLDKMTETELREYLSDIPINKIPRGNSRFKCKKHDVVLSYGDIVSGCFHCIMDESRGGE